MTTSTLMSGYSRKSGASFGTRIVSVAFSVAVIRMVPAGFSRSSLMAETSASISSKRGPMLWSRRSPASVGETLRVVRLRSRTPSRSSSSRMVWLSADWETPSLAAALVKLRSRATATKALRSSRQQRDPMSLVQMLPLTIEMRDHLRQEKTGNLPSPLPAVERQLDFSTGTLGLWSSNHFVIYYRDGRVPQPGIIMLGQATGDISFFDRPGPVTVRLQRIR